MKQTTLWGMLIGALGLLLLSACSDASSPKPPAAGVAQGKPTLLFFYTDN